MHGAVVVGSAVTSMLHEICTLRVEVAASVYLYVFVPLSVQELVLNWSYSCEIHSSERIGRQREKDQRLSSNLEPKLIAAGLVNPAFNWVKPTLGGGLVNPFQITIWISTFTLIRINVNLDSNLD